MSDQHPQFTDLDRAVSTRLAKLSRAPVDTSRLERKLDATLRRIPAEDRAPALRLLRSWRFGVGIAALLALCATAAVVVSTTEPMVADRYTSAEVVLAHELFLGESPPPAAVPDMCDADCRCRAVRAEASEIPELAEYQMQCCCVTPFTGCRAACLHFDYQSVPVTMVVAKKARLDAPEGSIVDQDGRSFTIAAQGRYQVLAVSDEEGSLCFVSELLAERLLGLAAGIARQASSGSSGRF
jgi:hypothetical protein